MKQFRIALSLALATLVAVVFAAPAAASTVWTEEGEPLLEPVELQISGVVDVGYQWGTSCDVTATLTLYPGDQGEIDNLVFDECVGTGSMAHLPANVDVIGGVPLGVQIGASGTRIESSTKIEEHVKVFYWEQVLVEANRNVIWESLTPDNTEAISTLELDGAYMTGTYCQCIEGEIQLSPEDSGMYGWM